MELKNLAHYFCAQAIERLLENGIDHFFFGSGSRSTPIVSAIARHRDAKSYMSFDERCVGFMALGYGKRSQKPGVVVVTSGTAVAHLHPAVVEAFMSSVPMLIITADRPYELRDCGANQTIFQANLFAHHIIKNFDLAPPSSVVPVEKGLAIFDQAVSYTVGAKKGPVHINLQLREPLTNVIHDNENFIEQSFVRKAPRITNVKHFIHSEDLIGQFCVEKSGLLVVGELLPSTAQEQILELAVKTGWPIVADVASNLRFISHDQVIRHYDLKLLNQNFFDEFKFKTVIKFGSRIVSKRFWQWVEKQTTTRFISIDATPDRIDPTGRFEHVYVGSLEDYLDGLLKHLSPRDFVSQSQFNDAIVDKAIASFLDRRMHNEGYYAARLVAQISEPVSLFLSSGMPIRDVDQFATSTKVPIEVFVNRGASGIDGIMSTALGIAIADDKPAVVLLGDMAFIHDTNALMSLFQSRHPLLIVAINNGGGGIFHFLPIAAESDVITPYLDMPHDVKIEWLCRAHGISYSMVQKPEEFDLAIDNFFATRTTTVVEVLISRTENVQLHKDFYREMAALKVKFPAG